LWVTRIACGQEVAIFNRQLEISDKSSDRGNYKYRAEVNFALMSPQNKGLQPQICILHANLLTKKFSIRVKFRVWKIALPCNCPPTTLPRCHCQRPSLETQELKFKPPPQPI